MSLDAVVNDETGGWERAETPQDLRQLLAELHWADRAAAIERLRAAVAAADTAGLPAQAALLRYMQQVAEDVQRSADVADQGGPDTLLVQAWRAAPAALEVFFLLRKHPAAITKELFARGRQLFFGPGAAMRDAEKAACVLAVIGVMLQDPEYGAQAHLFWQGILQHDGDLAGAARHLARARQLAEIAENSATIAGADLAVARLHEQSGDLAAAAEAYENGLEADKQAGLTLRSLPILERLADIYRQLGRPERALARLDQAIPLMRSLGDEHKLLDALNFRGLLIEDTGDYLTGGEVFESVATAAAAAGLLDIEFKAATNAAMSMLKRQRRNEAIDRYRRVLVRARSSGRQNLIAAAQNDLGQALLNAGRAADAAQQLGPAFFYGVSSQDNGRAAFAAIGLSDAYARLGDADNARTAHSLAAMYALQSGDDSLFTLWVTRLPSHQTDPRASLPALRDAWSRARQSGNLQDESLITLTLVDVLERTGAFAEAEAVCAESLQAALDADAQSPWRLRLSREMADLVSRDPARSAEAYQLVEEGSQLVEQRMRNARSDQARSEIVADQTGLLGLKINLLCKHGLELKEAGLLTADVHPGTMAFASHQIAKAPFLVSILARGRFEPPARVNAELREEEARLLAARAQLDDPDTARHGLATGTDKRGEIRAKLDACWRRMEPVAPGYVAQRRGLPASAAEVAGLLERVDPSAALVSFFADDRQTTCFVIRAGDQEPSVSTIEMGRPEIESVVRQIRRAFNGSPDEFPPYPPIRGTRPWTRPLTMLENLSDRLLSSFLPVVDGAEVLCIAPHGPLHLLPWAALRAPAGHYLAEQFGVTVTPTASMLRYLADDQRTGPDGPLRALVAGVAAAEDRHPDYFENDADLLSRSLWEVENRSGLLADKESTQAALAVRDLVHLTCHGFFEPNRPLESGLVLSDGSTRPPRDPFGLPVSRRRDFVLTAGELLKESLSADLTVLRACVSGVQRVENAADELQGLATSLLSAGSASLLVSLWNVDQRSSRELLKLFYETWVPHKPAREKWRALAAAQRALIDGPNEAWRHPYHWAPLTLIGDWR